LSVDVGGAVGRPLHNLGAVVGPSEAATDVAWRAARHSHAAIDSLVV
jgi:hypothetical protein